MTCCCHCARSCWLAAGASEAIGEGWLTPPLPCWTTCLTASTLTLSLMADIYRRKAVKINADTLQISASERQKPILVPPDYVQLGMRCQLGFFSHRAGSSPLRFSLAKEASLHKAKGKFDRTPAFRRCKIRAQVDVDKRSTWGN